MSTELNKWLSQLIPSQCIVCQNTAIHRLPNLCTDCEQAIPYLVNTCLRCCLPLPAPSTKPSLQSPERTICGRCLASPPSYDFGYCPLKYDAFISKMIIHLKHHQDLAVASTLSDIFVRRYLSYLNPQANSPKAQTLQPDLIIPIPLNWLRWLARGFNQSQCLARLVALELNIPMANYLSRIKHTKPQQGLNRKKRLQNLRGSFKLEKQAISDIEGKHIVLFDDVMTTGATMEAAAFCLKQAGAKSVMAWSIARAC